ncbi:MAG: hypothetical protein P8Y23_17445 [Candidatus Lokiarchaeota archaeon]|jgi:predicted ATP-dependent serine protease
MIFPLKELNNNVQFLDQNHNLISIWGDFGVGKTTFSLQTALYHSSLNNLVIYVYTKPNRPLNQMKRLVKKFNNKKLDTFLFYSISNFSDIFDFTLNIEQLIINFKNVSNTKSILMVIDSITYLYQIELRKGNKSKNVILNYKLNQILGILSYLTLQYPIDILVINYLRRLKRKDQTIEVQSGGKVMNYWINFSIKIERDKKLNFRKFLLSTLSEKKEISILSRLTEFGFE